ncbi:MAG TPA: hypothetical protein VNT20_10035 [Flavisolibacter sp.]|jgi:hypothetical protein|nr:hypothetical protein [Flavisolibacter sp.]
MNEEIKQGKPITQEYVKAKPEILPKPTYMPFVFAFSLLLLGWGLLTTWIISVAGGLGICISLYGWIKELLHEQRDEY